MKIQRLRRKYRRKYGHPDPALLKSWNFHMQPPKIVPLVMPYLQGEARRKAKQMRFFERLEAEKQNDLINFVKAQDEKERIDFFGNDVGDADRIAGPFTAYEDGVTFSIDPRKL